MRLVDIHRLRLFPASGLSPDPTQPVLAAAEATRENEAGLAGASSAEPQAAAEGEFDIFDVHRRLICDYRAFTEGTAMLRDPRIAAFMEADLDAKSQWPTVLQTAWPG